MTQDHSEPISHSEAAGGSRRGILRLLGVGGASGLLALAGLEAMAGERPHERLQDRTPQRNRKQRNKRQNNKNNNTQNNNGGGGLGGVFGLGVSVQFNNPTNSTYTIRVVGENGDLNYSCPPGFNAILSTDNTAVVFVIHLDGWKNNLFLQAINPAFGEPYVVSGTEYDCTHSGEVSPPIFCGSSMAQTSLDVGESYQLDWEGKSFKAERQSDSSDFKMFLFTALA
jgi:hypothetical protein